MQFLQPTHYVILCIYRLSLIYYLGTKKLVVWIRWKLEHKKSIIMDTSVSNPGIPDDIEKSEYMRR